MIPPETYRSLAVGLTGGIGSGKSQACRLLAGLGAKTLSADLIARELLDTDASLKVKVQKLFGTEIYLQDGTLDRKRVAKRVFQDPALKESLEAIVHPETLKAIDSEIDRISAAGEAAVIVVEAALIFEARAENMFDYVVVVDAPEEARVQRVMERDKVSRHEVEDRMGAQMSAEDKVGRADFVLKNSADLAALERNTRFLFTLLLSISRMPHVDDESQE
jgi:dephospho-CoA kinase